MAYCTTAEVRAQLRLKNEDVVDEAKIARAIVIGAELIDEYLDRVDTDPLPDPAPAAVVQANIQLAVEEYRRPSFGLYGSDELGPQSVSADRLRGVRSLLVRHKQQWGLA